MADINESINEMIEESYLLGLSEGEIREDLDRFLEICGKVIRENVQDRGMLERLSEKLARTRALSLIEDRHDSGQGDLLPDTSGERAAQDRFAEKVARNKRLILRAIRECDPRLEALIEKERFPSPAEKPEAQPGLVPSKPRGGARDLVLKTCYAVTLLFMLLLVYLVLLQNV